MNNDYNWVSVLPEGVIKLEVLTLSLPTKGKLVYEYNPFRNYRLSENKYWYKNNYYSLEELKSEFLVVPSSDKLNWEGVPKDVEDPVLYEKGLLVDFITDELKFSLDHPVHIVPLYSYDGSVNLIINDGINIPRLINSRFSATGKNTYEIVDRKGNNDTNIYDLGELFDIDTSLYKRVTRIPRILFNGVSSGGNMPIGNYHFYFKLSDSDGNETDFIGESGLVSIFIGFNDPHSVHTGTKNGNSFKCISFLISNIDSAYDNVYVYYSRYTSELNDNFLTQYKKIDKKFPVNNTGYCNIVITGFEYTYDISSSDINLSYNIVDGITTSATCLNMLFLANVHKPEIPYNELADLSLRFLPYLKLEKYLLLIDLDYNISSSTLGYYDPLFIYNKTGYWDNEIYRFGVVYILPNGELTPVFNIRGGDLIREYDEDNEQYSKINIYDEENLRIYINYNNESFLLIQDGETLKNGNSRYELNKNIKLENVKGVLRFEANSYSDIIYGVDIRASKELIDELKKYVKGYFFVRQTRIPTILALGITIGIDNESRTPCLPTVGGILNDLPNLSLTYVETNNIKDVNYISEGFLSRFSFTLKAKSSFFSLLSNILSAVALVSSFIPGIGLIANLAILSTNFLVSSITLGSFLTAAFISTLASAVPALGSVATKVTSKIVADAKRLNELTSTAYKLLKVSTTVSKISTVATPVANVVAKSMNAIDMSTLSYDYISTEISKNSGTSYNGRNTEVPKGFKKVENLLSRILSDNFIDRIIIKDPAKVKVQGIICPDYEINQAYYNLIFTGNKHLIRYSKSLGVNRINVENKTYSSSYFNNYNRHFYHLSYYDSNVYKIDVAKIVGVPDNVKVVGIEDLMFRSRAGEAEESWRYESVGREYKDSTEKKENTDIIRGSFGPYLATNSNKLDPATIVDIMIPDYSEANILKYFLVRMDDTSTFSSISERIDILDLKEYLVTKDRLLLTGKMEFHYELYRGDCYICLFTHRLNRNFNDPSSPYNDEIVDLNSWKDNYDPDNTEKYLLINLGDVNAVPLGMWVTFKFRSSNNLNIRTLDYSNVDESAMVGHSRGYYPYNDLSVEGTYKHPESLIYNKGFSKSLSERWNFELPDVPYIKNWFGTRIMYSDIHINDAYKNGFRVFLGNHYRDYTREYGEIVKLISLESSLLCVFEHGVALIPVNERAVAGEGAGGNVYINTSNVLPENPMIISDTIGSLWAESILKVPGKTGDSILYVYGVDTVAKKIWRTDGNSLTCISDFRVLEFLNNNITLGERELTPKIGIRNVKTVYNAFKRDVLFTFYDNTYGFEEKVWNLCWNELLLKFITFYSWVPSYMENINNIPFSFNRDTSKWIAKLGTSHSNNSFADGITLSNVFVEDTYQGENTIPYSYVSKNGSYVLTTITIPSSIDENVLVGVLSLSNRILPNNNVFYQVEYSLERDQYLNNKLFKILKISDFKIPQDGLFLDKTIPIYGLFLDKSVDVKKLLYSEIYYRNKEKHYYSDYDINKIDSSNMFSDPEYFNYPIFKDITGKRINLPKDKRINDDKIVRLLSIKAKILIIDNEKSDSLSNDYYNMKAGFLSGTTLIDAGYYLSVVAVIPKWNMLFLSTDFWKHGLAGLVDIADDIYPTYWYGRLHPFEFECIVVNDPSVHKIFTNLEIIANKAKPESFHYEIIGETYDFAKDKVNMYFRLEAMKALWLYNGADISYDRNFLKVLPRLLPKSADFPHKYYTRQDTINEIENYYIHVTYPSGYDYSHLSGAEIVYYPNRLEYRIWNHAPAINLDELSLESSRSIIAANCLYIEDRWRVSINPILVCYKNEYKRINSSSDYLMQPKYSTWAKSKGSSLLLPSLPIYNSPIPDLVLSTGSIDFPGNDMEHPEWGEDNALYNLYDLSNYNSNGNWKPLDLTNWLDDINIYKYNFGEAHNRKEVDVRDKFLKIRIRYSGEELAVIDFLNTIYRVSYS